MNHTSPFFIHSKKCLQTSALLGLRRAAVSMPMYLNRQMLEGL